jgi:hypothetical protein
MVDSLLKSCRWRMSTSSNTPPDTGVKRLFPDARELSPRDMTDLEESHRGSQLRSLERAAVVVVVGEFVVGGLKREEMVIDLVGAIATTW